MDELLWVDWQITSKCKRNCDFCFGPSSNYKDLNIKEVLKIIDIFNNVGVNVIGITGGEPLIRKDIITIIKYIYDSSMLVYLSTNCDYYKEYRNDLLKYVEIFRDTNRITYRKDP